MRRLQLLGYSLWSDGMITVSHGAKSNLIKPTIKFLPRHSPRQGNRTASPDLGLLVLVHSLHRAPQCMPPRKKAASLLPDPAAPSNKYTDLVTLGSRQVQVKHPSRLDENGLLPSTARALVLRNGKQGAMGTGELMSLRKPIGREKLDLLGGKPLSDEIN
jgi:hypothetical protein